MKPKVLAVSVYVLMALPFASGQIQDNSRAPGSVDASVHAGVEVQAQPESSQGAAKRTPTFSSWSSGSSWSSQPARPASLTTAWPTQTTRSNLADTTVDSKDVPFSSLQPARQTESTVLPALDHAPDGTSRKLGRPTDSFSFAILPLTHAQGRSTRLGLSLPAMLPSTSSETQGFPRPFLQKQSGQAFNSFRTNLSHGKTIRAKRSKGYPAKSGDLSTGYSSVSTTGGKR